MLVNIGICKYNIFYYIKVICICFFCRVLNYKLFNYRNFFRMVMFFFCIVFVCRGVVLLNNNFCIENLLLLIYELKIFVDFV